MSAAWDELAKPQPDTARVEQLFDEAGEKRRAMQHETTSQTVDLLGALSPVQRAKFVSIMHEWRAAWRQRAANR
jgi:Spy/CpxP family protein refolding chaperone